MDGQCQIHKEEITVLCLELNCSHNRLICKQCVMQYHQSHKSIDIMVDPIQQLNSFFSQNYQILPKYSNKNDSYKKQIQKISQDYIRKIEQEQKQQINQFKQLQNYTKQQMMSQFDAVKYIFEFSNDQNINYITESIKIDDLEQKVCQISDSLSTQQPEQQNKTVADLVALFNQQLQLQSDQKIARMVSQLSELEGSVSELIANLRSNNLLLFETHLQDSFESFNKNLKQFNDQKQYEIMRSHFEDCDCQQLYLQDINYEKIEKDMDQIEQYENQKKNYKLSVQTNSKKHLQSMMDHLQSMNADFNLQGRVNRVVLDFDGHYVYCDEAYSIFQKVRLFRNVEKVSFFSDYFDQKMSEYFMDLLKGYVNLDSLYISIRTVREQMLVSRIVWGYQQNQSVVKMLEGLQNNRKLGCFVLVVDGQQLFQVKNNNEQVQTAIRKVLEQ